MSQLKKCLLLIIFLFLGMTSYIVFAKAGQKTLRAEIESPYKWGKGMGPIQVRIEEKEHKGNVFTLEGQISTKLDAVNIQWKLPSGVTLISGKLSELASSLEENTVISRTISVKIASPLTVPHIVFFVYTGIGENQRGNTAVYNLNETESDKDKIEEIRGLMKARSSQPMK